MTHRGPPPGVGIPGPVLLSRIYKRNDAGEPDKITHEDGRFTEIDYDPAGRVKEERYFDSVGVLRETITYGYDLDGNRNSRTSNAGIEVYEYDTGSRLTRITLDGVETQRFEYDQNGRVTRIVRDGLDQRLTWDALDRLVRVEDVDAVQNPVDFTYDGQGRRVGRDGGAHQYVVGPTGNQSLESPHLVHNGFFLTGELVYNGEHALWRYDGNEPPETRIYLRDAMGSVIGLMDENGALVERFEYDAFGNVRGAGGEALPLSLGGDSRFQGMWKDTGTGLYYVRARYYDARTGTFLSRDPAEGQLETPESFYPYVFANGNPWTGRDPTGEFTLREVVAVGVVIGALALVGTDTGRTVLGNFRAGRVLSGAASLPQGTRYGLEHSLRLQGVYGSCEAERASLAQEAVEQAVLQFAELARENPEEAGRFLGRIATRYPDSIAGRLVANLGTGAAVRVLTGYTGLPLWVLGGAAITPSYFGLATEFAYRGVVGFELLESVLGQDEGALPILSPGCKLGQ